jgi:hypothetical protein
MQAPPDELLKSSAKVHLFIANGPGKEKSVIQYMEALLKQHGADTGALKKAMLKLDLEGPKTIRNFAHSPHCIEGGELEWQKSNGGKQAGAGSGAGSGTSCIFQWRHVRAKRS